MQALPPLSVPLIPTFTRRTVPPERIRREGFVFLPLLLTFAATPPPPWEVACESMTKGKKQPSKVNIRNKKAEFDYHLLAKYTAGIVLTGTEIKSIRAGKASLVDSYCVVIRGEVWVKNMYVAPYENGSYNNHVERRDRKLLLNRQEIHRIESALKAPGLTLVPTLLFLNEGGRAKLDINVARGKRAYDKRETLKEKEDRREMARSMKKSY